MPENVQRPAGSINFHDSSLGIWEEPTSCSADYEEGFRRVVLAAVVRFLRGRGWRVNRDPEIHRHYRILDKSHRYCTHPSGLQAHIEQGGRHIELCLHQAVTKPDHRNGSRYGCDKLEKMPYLLRLQTVATLTALSAELCSRFGYHQPKVSLRDLLFGETYLTNQERLARQLDGWGRPMPGFNEQPRYNRESAEKELLSDGDRVWFLDDKGRWMTGTAWYGGGNSMWWVLWGVRDMAHKSCSELRRQPPTAPRSKVNQDLRRERLKKLMHAAAGQEDFRRAEVLRRALAGEPGPGREGTQLFYIQDTRSIVGNCASWWRPNGGGYTCDLSEAGLYTAAQVQDRDLDRDHRPWPREVVERLVMRHVRAEALRDAAGAHGGAR